MKKVGKKELGKFEPRMLFWNAGWKGVYKVKDRVEVARNDTKELGRGLGVKVWPALW